MNKSQLPVHEYSRETNMILPEMNSRKYAAPLAFRLLVASFVVMICLFAGTPTDAATKQKGFASPEEAVNAFAAALKGDDNKELGAIFGPGVKELISSGDPAHDKQRRESFIRNFDLKNSLVPDGKKMILTVGETDWPFAIPIVQKGKQWFFDTNAGGKEILHRRVGANELSTIQTMLAIVDAQREYAMKDSDRDGVLEYASKFRSDPGKKNGLYWETKDGEDESPLGAFVADARAEGYVRMGGTMKPMPYHGYYFRMLTKQGKHAPGGAFDYVVNGKQIGGFAVVAFPAKYGNSGVMTFLANHDGVVYQKNIGKETAKITKEMKAFDPDSSWKKAEPAG
jgi:hypothetical protein